MGQFILKYILQEENDFPWFLLSFLTLLGMDKSFHIWYEK